MLHATPTNVITAIKGLVEDGLLPDVYEFLYSPYSEVDFTSDKELNGFVVAASQEAPEGDIELALVRRQSRVIYAKAKLSGLAPRAAAMVVVGMLAQTDVM